MSLPYLSIKLTYLLENIQTILETIVPSETATKRSSKKYALCN